MTRILMGCVLLILTACSGGDRAENTSHSLSKAMQEKIRSIELNDGKPWKADEEMIHHVSEMKKMLEDQLASSKMDKLAVERDLDRHISKFVESCTMKGKGHEELHKWLEPYMGLIQNFYDTESDEEAREIMGEMIAMLKIFGEYFE